MLSIIIPAYNEEKNICATVSKLLKDMEKIERDFEIIVVSDGSNDNTCNRAKSLKNQHLKVFEYQPNKGKGYALTYGVKKSNGEIVTFLDAGGDFDTQHIDKFIKLMEVFDADIVIGSKRHPASKINYPAKRRFYSYLYHVMIRILFNLNIKDTQTGLKVFKREVLEKILPRALVKQYAFDLELLVIAKCLGYNRIFEAPVNMSFNFNGTGINSKTIFYMLKDTMAIFYRRYILKYYNKPHILVNKR
ncbi:hypothetical protein A3F08_00410 [Candidatus Berkelbacteria bacterium RIFCSPHIGHO2_12_FULL_36_9]|uniref:Glycosyltransferase 2-like domain-containing protein n=1 Tax=Candidatus Berkelbacteria bacterium RIFCSPHIGHO2_12_FULL_36_9 TaxID=1797469 RepID=A0A1F5EHC8_9BACT|nr:MAG: hypothetical protein A3F08_00410 [Candidatus Berkelbacteria bacterium RIFCSPHIGHO2_12_FULL_36_9]